MASLVRYRRLDRVLRYSDDLRDLLHRLLVVVDQIDDLPVLRRERGQAHAQGIAGILLLYRHFRVVGGVGDRSRRLVVQFRVRPAPQGRKRLEPHNPKQPSGNRRPALEPARLPPDVKEYLADKILGELFVPHQAKSEAKHPDVMAAVQHPHRGFVALGNSGNQGFVCGLQRRTQWPSHEVSRPEPREGSRRRIKTFRPKGADAGDRRQNAPNPQFGASRLVRGSSRRLPRRLRGSERDIGLRDIGPPERLCQRDAISGCVLSRSIAWLRTGHGTAGGELTFRGIKCPLPFT